VHCLSDENVLARKRRTELCLQVYLPSSRYDLQLDKTCCKVSDWRQKEQLDYGETAHLQSFFLSKKSVIKILYRKIENVPRQVLLDT